MPIVRPRITDFHGILLPQATTDFAIPFLDEDIPLYVDPFLLVAITVATGPSATHGADQLFQSPRYPYETRA